MQNIWHGTFNESWNLLAGRDSKTARDANARQRLARVKFVQRYRGYLLGANTNTGLNAAGTITIARTPVLTHPALVLDFNALCSPTMEIEVTRTNPSRTQISNEFLWFNHYGTAQQGSITNPSFPFAETPWIEPFSLATNELLRVRFRQTVAGPAETEMDLGVTFRVIGLNKMPCPLAHWQRIEDYIRSNREQYPIWLTTFSEDARTITFPGAGTGQRTIANTREAPEPLLLTAFALPGQVFSSGVTKAKIRIISSDGHILTPVPVLLGTLYQFSGFNEGGPGGGWYWWYELPMPHYLEKGGTVTVELTDTTTTANNLNRLELVWRAVTI